MLALKRPYHRQCRGYVPTGVLCTPRFAVFVKLLKGLSELSVDHEILNGDDPEPAPLPVGAIAGFFLLSGLAPSRMNDLRGKGDPLKGKGLSRRKPSPRRTNWGTPSPGLILLSISTLGTLINFG